MKANKRNNLIHQCSFIFEQRYTLNKYLTKCFYHSCIARICRLCTNNYGDKNSKKNNEPSLFCRIVKFRYNSLENNLPWSNCQNVQCPSFAHKNNLSTLKIRPQFSILMKFSILSITKNRKEILATNLNVNYILCI